MNRLRLRGGRHFFERRGGPNASCRSLSIWPPSNAKRESIPGTEPNGRREWIRSVLGDGYPQSTSLCLHEALGVVRASSHAQASRTERRRLAVPRKPARLAHRSTGRRLKPALCTNAPTDRGTGRLPKHAVTPAQIESDNAPSAGAIAPRSDALIDGVPSQLISRANKRLIDAQSTDRMRTGT
jgi:hypothetical protein